MATAVLASTTNTQVLEQAKIKLENKNLLGLILPNPIHFNPLTTTKLPTVSGAVMTEVLEGEPIPVQSLKVTTQSLSTKKLATIILLTKELVKSSPEGAVNFLVQNISEAITTKLYTDLESITNETATKIEDGLGKVSHIAGGGIILVKDMILAKQFLNLPAGYEFVLAPITSKAIIIPNASVGIAEEAVEVVEDSEAMVNLQGDTDLKHNVVSLYQQDYLGVRVIKNIGMVNLSTIVKVS